MHIYIHTYIGKSELSNIICTNVTPSQESLEVIFFGAALSGIIHSYIHTYIYTHMHSCIHTYIHTYIHINQKYNKSTYNQYSHTTHTYIIHTYIIHTCTLTYIHTLTEEENNQKIHCQILEANKTLLFDDSVDSSEEKAKHVTKFSDVLPLGMNILYCNTCMFEYLMYVLVYMYVCTVCMCLYVCMYRMYLCM